MATQDRRLEENDSSRRTLIIVVAVAAAVVIALFFYLLMRAGSGGGEPRLADALRPGSAEFEQYKSQIVLDDTEAFESPRALGDIVMSLKTTVRNLSNKTLNGLEMRAVVVDGSGNTVKERTVIVIPARQPELQPNKTMDVSIMLEGFKETDYRANVKMEVAALKFKQ